MKVENEKIVDFPWGRRRGGGGGEEVIRFGFWAFESLLLLT